EHEGLRGVNVVTQGVQGGVGAAEARVRELAEKMLGSTLVTVQTGPTGKQVNRLYVEQGMDIARELYLSVVLDRSVGRSVVMGSSEGGMDSAVVAAETPECLVRVAIDPLVGLAYYRARSLAFALGLAGDTHKKGGALLNAVARAA